MNIRQSTSLPKNMLFSDGSMSITFAQPEEGATALRDLDAIVAEHQCRAYIAKHPKEEFKVTVKGSCAAPAVEVALQAAMLERLPLLHDVEDSTANDSKPAAVELPCTVWGLVSLLILLQGNLTVDEWFGFGRDPHVQDASLPANTLVVRASCVMLPCTAAPRKPLLSELHFRVMFCLQRGP